MPRAFGAWLPKVSYPVLWLMSCCHASSQVRKLRTLAKQRAEEAKLGDAAVPVPAPAPQLQPSFDADVTTHRYNVLESPTGVIARWVAKLPRSFIP